MQLPWRPHTWHGHQIENREGNFVGSIPHGEERRYAIAAANACAGIPVEALEIMAKHPGAMQAAFKYVVNAVAEVMEKNKKQPYDSKKDGARDGIEAQHGLNDTYPGDKV